jgi:hypothetical protein
MRRPWTLPSEAFISFEIRTAAAGERVTGGFPGIPNMVRPPE